MNEMMKQREGKRRHVTSEGLEGGGGKFIIEFLGGFGPITPALSPKVKDSNHTSKLLFGTLIGSVRTGPRKEKQKPPNQNPKQEEARRVLSRRRGKGSETATRTVKHAEL